MALFLSTYVNKVDQKGRVSVPAPFRTVLAREEFPGIIAYSSFVYGCIESCGMQRLEKISETIDQMDPFSEERDAFATSILGGAMQLQFDADGRVLLPEILIEYAKLKDKAVFVGKGQTFEIWNPEMFETYSNAARDMAKDRRGTLRFHPSVKS